MEELKLDWVQSLLQSGELVNPQHGPLRFSAGSRLFAEGDPGDCAYMIESGYVEVSRNTANGKVVLDVLGAGEIVGEMALIDGLPRSATAIAVHDTDAVLIPRQEILEAVETASPMARLVLMAALKRLRGLRAINGSGNDCETASANHEYSATRIEAASRLKARTALEAAIRNREFQLVYQPIVSLLDGRTAGFEALLRWPQPDQQAVSPADFIPLAEVTGLIRPLGLWLLSEALHAMKGADLSLAKQSGSARDFFFSVNVSPRQLDSDSYVEKLAQLLEQPDVDSSRIKLEITEQALIGDPVKAMVSLGRLRATGASIAIDDFGTGYSSLSYLHQFPLDTMKIDRSFIYRITENPGGQRVVAAIIALAHELGMDVVAEGIENVREVKWLQSHSCRFGQGYLMARPAPLPTAIAHLGRYFEW